MAAAIMQTRYCIKSSLYFTFWHVRSIRRLELGSSQDLTAPLAMYACAVSVGRPLDLLATPAPCISRLSEGPRPRTNLNERRALAAASARSSFRRGYQGHDAFQSSYGRPPAAILRTPQNAFRSASSSRQLSSAFM